jgi:hypothetical protein
MGAGIIGRVLKTGGGNEQLMSATPGTTLRFHTVGPGGVYFTFSGAAPGVAVVPLGGGLPTTIANTTTAPGDIVADGTNVYWVDGATIMSMPLAGGSPVPLAVAQQPGVIAVDGTDLYWTNGAPDSIRKVAK